MSPAATNMFMENNIPEDEKVMAVIITNTKAGGMLTYDAVRYAWKLSASQLQKANQSQYVLAIENSTVVDIFERHGEFHPNDENSDRYWFSPVPVTDVSVRRRYIGKHYRSTGAAVIFFGYEKD